MTCDQKKGSGDKIDDKPLSGLTVGITGTPSFTARLETALKSQGAKTLPVMKMEVVPDFQKKKIQTLQIPALHLKF